MGEKSVERRGPKGFSIRWRRRRQRRRNRRRKKKEAQMFVSRQARLDLSNYSLDLKTLITSFSNLFKHIPLANNKKCLLLHPLLAIFANSNEEHRQSNPLTSSMLFVSAYLAIQESLFLVSLVHSFYRLTIFIYFEKHTKVK